MTHAVVTHDAEWLPEDIDAALEWQAAEDSRCSGCGHPLDETLDTSLQEWTAREVVCPACTAIELHKRTMAGAKVFAERVELVPLRPPPDGQ